MLSLIFEDILDFVPDPLHGKWMFFRYARAFSLSLCYLRFIVLQLFCGQGKVHHALQLYVPYLLCQNK